jgi:hypothetical protein
MDSLTPPRPSPKPFHRLAPDPGTGWWRNLELSYHRRQVRRLLRERAQANISAQVDSTPPSAS